MTVRPCATSSGSTLPTAHPCDTRPRSGRLTGSPAWDLLALAEDSRRRLLQTLERHPQVNQILGAHLHRPLLTQFASRPLLVAPSTYVQFPLSAQASELDPTDEPPGYVIHLISEDGQLTSYFQSVTLPANSAVS
jgi:hypothetical protein